MGIRFSPFITRPVSSALKLLSKFPGGDARDTNRFLRLVWRFGRGRDEYILYVGLVFRHRVNKATFFPSIFSWPIFTRLNRQSAPHSSKIKGVLYTSRCAQLSSIAVPSKPICSVSVLLQSKLVEIYVALSVIYLIRTKSSDLTTGISGNCDTLLARLFSGILGFCSSQSLFLAPLPLL